MLRTVPPAYIKEYQSYNYRPIDEIPDEVFQSTAERIKKLQSDDPLVSLVFIAYNEEDYIFATLYSVSFLESDYPLEIIVVNNNSKDRTQEVLDKCGVPTIFEESQGYAFARQAGLKKARGKYIISGDTDTLYPPGWVDPLIKKMENDSRVVCTYSRFAFYRDDHDYGLSLFLYERARLMDIYFKSLRRPHLNVRGFSMAFRKDVAMKIGGYNTKVIRGSDGYLGLELLNHGKVELVSDNKSMVYTNMRRTQMDGSLMKAFLKRSGVTMRYFFHMFTKQKIK